MGFKTRIQVIQRKASRQFYINFPSACAQMLDLRKGEEVEWEFTPTGDLVLRRQTRKHP
jgi:antitoxin component of MazEF toxin-antitoxin module